MQMKRTPFKLFYGIILEFLAIILGYEEKFQSYEE